MPTLIVTNGDSAAELLAEAGEADAVLPWRDVLHEGPITNVSLEELTSRRAAFLADRFGLDDVSIEADFAARNEALAGHADFDRIELWFEHDLYDQLQLIQILSFLSDQDRVEGLCLVQAGDYLGHQSPATIGKFRQSQRPLLREDLALARMIWGELAAPEPGPIVRRYGSSVTGFPFLGSALSRFVEELPGTNGLSRSEQTLLSVVAAGNTPSTGLFNAVLEQEDAAFMGDVSFIAMLDDLATGPIPLIDGLSGEGPDPSRLRSKSGSLRLTEAGRAVLGGAEDHIRLNGIDRWWAGTHLRGHDVWRYDRTRQILVPPSESTA